MRTEAGVRIERYLRVAHHSPFEHGMPEPGTIYVAAGHLVFHCPCGCGELVSLEEGYPWTLAFEQDGPTLSTAVHTVDGCRSHFSIRQGLVVWA